MKFYERPDKDGACVADGSEYYASLITGEDFGCSLYCNYKPIRSEKNIQEQKDGDK